MSAKNLIFRRIGLPVKIQRINFEVTKMCNGHCIYCDIWKKKPDPKEEITIQEVYDGLQPRSLFKHVEEIAPTGGEPFLRKDLVDLCQILKEICPNASFGMVTNGLLPDLVLKKMVELREIDPLVNIGVSLDGFAHSDTLQRGNARHCELAWQTVELLKNEGFKPSVGSVVTSINIDEMLNFRNFCWMRNLGHGLVTANPSEHFYGNIDNPNLVDLQIPKEKYFLFKKICMYGRVTAFNYYFPQYLENPRQIMPCFSGFNSFFLNSIGQVYPCIHLNNSLGSIRESVFGKIWKGEKAASIRKAIVRQECHCYTFCEVDAWFRANIFPVIIKEVRMKLAN